MVLQSLSTQQGQQYGGSCAYVHAGCACTRVCACVCWGAGLLECLLVCMHVCGVRGGGWSAELTIIYATRVVHEAHVKCDDNTN